MVVRNREEDRRWAEWQRQRDLARQRQEAEEERRREVAKRAEEEKQRRQALEQEAVNWQKAKLIQEYVDHIVGQVSTSTTPELLEWRRWALQVATDLDPTQARRGRG